MSTDTKASYKKPALEIKSTSFSTSVLAVFSTDLKQIQLLLEEKISLAPEFFKNSALLIDLQSCPNQKQSIDLSALIELLYAKKLIPIGISGGNKEQNKLALTFKIPVHTIRGTNLENNKSEPSQPISNNDNISLPVDKLPTNQEVSSETPIIENMLISQPVRSGQRVYAKGDLTILSHVGAGAEVMAEGNIHVYGALRGRALAGVQGNIESRIFCSSLEAELVSIAGNYKISEELDNTKNTTPVQIFLQNKSLIIEKL
jgi:septum site-determining protein MinC